MCNKIGRKLTDGESIVLPPILPGHERDGTDYEPFLMNGDLYKKCNCCHEIKSYDDFPDNQNSDNKGISIYDETGKDTGDVTKKRKQCNKCRMLTGKKNSGQASKVFNEHNVPNPTENTICECCGKTYEENGNKKMVRDHCHIRNIPRGYLCNECNTGLGKLGDDIDGIEKMLKYLEEVEGNNWKNKWGKEDMKLEEFLEN